MSLHLRFDHFLAHLALARDLDEEEELGRELLSSILHHASYDFLDSLLKAARRNNRLRRSLAAARYYSGLSRDKCDRIDAFLKAPFPAGGPSRRRFRQQFAVKSPMHLRRPVHEWEAILTRILKTIVNL
jgi:hypothetical protein